MAKLAKLRGKLQELGVDGVIVGSGDAHQSEYVTEIDMRRAFISDFTGSSGTALIFQNEAYLWTDGRYFLQATTQLSSEWTLMKSGEPGVLELNDWIIANIPSGRTIGVDPFLIAASQAKALGMLHHLLLYSLIDSLTCFVIQRKYCSQEILH
jgi:Xaa-Pro aminopeptidase